LTVEGLVALVPRERAESRKADNSNVVVWLTPVAGLSKRDDGIQNRPHTRRFRLMQRHKRFEPHVLVVPVGSVVDFPNLDPFFHNVFSLFEGKRFDLGLYEAGTTHSVNFDRPGVCYIFCNIHPEMSAVVVVLKTPYYAVSNRAGEVAIAAVPPGRYLMSVWNERCPPEVLKVFPREVTISASERSLGTIRLIESGDVLASHKNKYGRDYDRPNPPGSLYDRP
jgi:plastocyanin